MLTTKRNRPGLSHPARCMAVHRRPTGKAVSENYKSIAVRRAFNPYNDELRWLIALIDPV